MDANVAPPKPARRWYRFSLRSLLIATTLVGCGLGWLMHEVLRGREIERALGRVTSAVATTSHSPAPKWMQELFGRYFLATVKMRSFVVNDDRDLADLKWIEVEHADVRALVTDAGLGQLSTHPEVNKVSLQLSLLMSETGIRQLQRLPNLTELSITSQIWEANGGLRGLVGLNYAGALEFRITRLTDKDLACIEGIDQLTSLVVEGAASDPHVTVSEAGLKCLAKLTNLKDLQISDADFGGAGLERLESLTNLERLSLTRSAITDRELETLPLFARLKDLDLSNTKVIGEGPLQLGRLTSLERLNLARSRISSAGLASLAGLKNLRELDLSDTKITGSGLAYLGALPNLERLDLSNSKISNPNFGLPKLSNLTSLSLQSTNIGDDWLKCLVGQPQLLELDINFTLVSRAGAQDLEDRLPQCIVRYSPRRGLW